MIYEIFEQIFKYISTSLSVLVFLFTAILFVVNQIKKKQKKIGLEEENEELKETLKDEQAEYNLINEIIPIAIKKAEDTPNVDGATKKLLALSEILLQCSTNNINFELYKDFISEQIENLIEFSKTINKREQDTKE